MTARGRWLVAVAALAIGLAAGAARAAEGPAAGGPREIPLTIEGHRFTPAEITVAAGAPVVLVVSNKDKAAEEFESRDLRIEKIVPAGKTVRVRIPALKKGTYAFFGDFHPKTAQGRIVAQ
jgi:plastocyanin domain-containing protein